MDELEKVFDSLPKLSNKELMQAVEDFVYANEDGVDFIGNGNEIIYPDFCKYKHSFAEGLYVREMFQPKGTLMVGAIHKHSEVFILLKGKLIIATEDEPQEYIGPCYVVTRAGNKKMGVALEDCTLLTISSNPTDTQDLDELENHLYALTWEEYNEFIKQNSNDEKDK